MNTSRSRIEAWVSANQSGSITPNSAALAAGVLDMAEMLEGFALRLRELRRAKGLSQTELGKLAGLHYTHIGRYERESSRPSGDTLKRLADVLAPTVFDAAHSEFEERWFTLGTSGDGKLLAVSHTFQHTGPVQVRVRIISAREATERERQQYENGPR